MLTTPRHIVSDRDVPSLVKKSKPKLYYPSWKSALTEVTHTDKAKHPEQWVNHSTASNTFYTLRNRLAILTDPDAHKAIQLILDIYPDNPIYRRNYLAEKKVPDGRIPSGTWSTWLRAIGFSTTTVTHIEQIAFN